jgi:murein hydrolase activator
VRRFGLRGVAVALVFGAVLPAGADPGSPPPPPAAGANDLDRLMERLDGEDRALSAELAEAGPKLDVLHRRIVARGRAYYRQIRAGLLPAGGGFDALVDHAARVERTRLALERDVAAESTLAKRRAEIEARLVRLHAERAPLDVQREAMSRARVVIAEADERRAAFSRAFETSVRPGTLAVYGADTGPSDADGRAGFRGLKGKLPFPIAGRAEVHRVNRRSGPGLELTAPPGSPVRSVAAARVVFADRYDDYGLTVILDHGDHYYSVYGSLGSAEVQAGETLASGARVGTVGNPDGRGTMLYFEIRKNADAVDPATWLGI